MSSGLTDIPGGIAFAEKIAREDKNLEERAMMAFFAVNHGIRLMDRNRIACQLDSREHQFWYHNYFGGWAFFKSNTSYTKWYPAAVTARVRYPEQTSPVLNNVNGTVITSGYLMNTGGGSYQYTPFLETFCKGDLDTLLARHVAPTNANYASALRMLLNTTEYTITAAPHSSEMDDHYHITVDANLREGQIHVEVVSKPLASDRRGNVGFKWAGLNLMFTDS
jgi:hypothetical protein